MRWEGPPWLDLERDSSQMLTMLLKKLKGITKDMKIIDASFIYTEPHSKRMCIKVLISKEVVMNMKLEKHIKITFVEKTQQCDACRKSFTPHTWSAVVQVRQKVPHKRTILFLEQLILKNKAHEKCLKISEASKFINFIINIDEGLNFYFSHSPDAIVLMDFIQSQIIVRIKQSSKLISMNEKWGH